ncbi:MAG: DUF4091 domain-containing protein [Kiritimatiellae bacterium]|nr:DUF4091 domain-containing protein [Kiritimatiellia bacterium]
MLVARRHLFALWAVCAALSACGFDVSATPRVRVDAANAAQFTNAVWRAAAWRNERVHAPFVVRGTAGAGGFTARVVPETDRDAAVFAPAAVQVRWVRETLASASYRYPWVWVEVPEHKVGDILDPSQPFALTDRAFRALWVTVKTPPDAVPGRYRASLVVSDASGAEVRRALELEILPMALPARRKMYLDIWQTPWTVARYYGVKPFSPEHYAKMEPIFRELAAAGQKAITATITDYPWNVRKNIDSARTMVRYVKRRDGSFAADFSTLDEYVAFAKRCGIGPQIHCYAVVKFQKHRDYWYHDEASGEERHVDCDPGTPEYEAYWGPLLTQLEAHAKEKGWVGDIYVALDELRPPEVALTARLVKKYAPSLKFQMAGDVNPADFGDTRIDNYSQALRFDFVSREFLAEAARRRARGLITTYYVCCVPERPNSFLTSPLVEQRWLGLFAAAKGLDGFLKSTSHRWMMDRDPLVDASCKPGWAPGECFLIYPGPLLSLRWEMMVDGFEEFDKVAVLRESGRMTSDVRVALRHIDYQELLEGKTSDLERVVDIAERAIEKAARLAKKAGL